MKHLEKYSFYIYIKINRVEEFHIKLALLSMNSDWTRKERSSIPLIRMTIFQTVDLHERRENDPQIPA